MNWTPEAKKPAQPRHPHSGVSLAFDLEDDRGFEDCKIFFRFFEKSFFVFLLFFSCSFKIGMVYYWHYEKHP